MAGNIETLLLLALPASGKSELRKYMDSLSPEECAERFHMGQTVQLDDFPYVHMMRRIDDELEAVGADRIFFHSASRPFIDPVDWGTLIVLLNEDYEDLTRKPDIKPESAASWLFERIDEARKSVGAKAPFSLIDEAIQTKILPALEEEAADLLREKLEGIPDSLEGKTVVIEFARGGPDGSTPPLPEHFGYEHSLSLLSPAILSKAAILYVWVSPEESRRKNDARADPNDPGSILNHGVPIEVMMNDYGTDDMAYLIEASTRPDTVSVALGSREYFLPVGRFDNRVDKTTFLRKDQASWKAEELVPLVGGLKDAFDHLWTQYSDLHK